MDGLVIVRAADHAATAMVAAVAEVVDDRPIVVHSSGEAEIALHGHARDLVVVDPEVAPLRLVASGGRDGGHAIVGWLAWRSSPRAAELLDAGASEVLDAGMAREELGARLRRVLRSHPIPVLATSVVASGLTVDARLHEVSWDGRPLALSPRETEVLQVLVAAHGATVSRQLIYRHVWRWTMPRGDRTVDVNVKRLRAKLAAADVRVEIVTQPGVGYRLRVDGASERSAPPVVTGL